MKTTVNVFDFVDAFKKIRPDNFSHAALVTLFDYLEEWEESAGEELDLDVIALCCDFSEATPREIADSYGIDDDGLTHEETAGVVREYLEDEGMYVGETQNGTFVYRNF